MAGIGLKGRTKANRFIKTPLHRRNIEKIGEE